MSAAPESPMGKASEHPTGALLEVDGLRVTARTATGGRLLVDGLSLTLHAGESLGLVGESGSGKSMTARAALRLLPATFDVDGDVRFDGESVSRMSRSQLRDYRTREVAMVFQDPRAHTNPVRTVGAHLIEVLRSARNMSRQAAEAAAVQALEEVAIPQPASRLRQYPHQLSGGMLQRVMIAAALLGEPRLLVADEPTTALDVTTQSDVMATLGELRRQRGLAMLFITHDLELAAATCDRIAVMYAGRVLETGPAGILDTEPAHPYTDGLLRSRPRIDERATRLQAIPGRPAAAHEVDPGCVFAPRCRMAVDLCREVRPAMRRVAGSEVACHRAEALLAQRGSHLVSGEPVASGEH